MTAHQRGHASCLLGITGLPGSGKSSFASALAALGAVIVSGDIAGYETLARPGVHHELIEAFGSGIASAGGAIDRAALGRQLTGRKRIAMLNRIVHPSLLELLAQRVRGALNAPHCPMVALDAALIPEWGIEPHFDLVIFVASPTGLRRARLEAAGRDLGVIELLEQSQMGEEDKKARSHIVIENVSTIERLNQRARALFSVLTSHNAEEDSCTRKLWND